MHEQPLQKIVAKADDLLAMTKHDLAPIMLGLALGQHQGAGFIPHVVTDINTNEGYPGWKKSQVEKHLNSIWHWIERQGWIEPSPGYNGQNGYRLFTEDGKAIAEGADPAAIMARQEFPRWLLHPEIIRKCESRFKSGHFSDAAETSFAVVRDRLRDLTGHEKGSDAFGKGKLHIKGAIAPHVDDDFNQAVKFLTMAIDMFRNEKGHTSETGVDDPAKALQYLVLSSLAMRHLDSAEIISDGGVRK